MPERVQRRRVKGEPGMPPGAVYVGRPSKWGNPFSELQIGVAYPSVPAEGVHVMAVRQFRALAEGGKPITLNERVVGGKGERELNTYTYPSVAEIRAELAGHDLACWCDLDEMCHADVLLEIANGAVDG